METPSRRALLVDCIQGQFFSELLKEGFVGPEIGKILIDDMGTVPPPEALLYHFRQFISSIGWLVLTVNVKSFSRPTFQVKAGRVPHTGVRQWCPERTIPPEKATASDLQEVAFLQALPGRGYSPFKQPVWAFLSGSRYGIRQLVKHAIELLPELMKWLKTGEPSSHVRVVRFARPAETQLNLRDNQ